MLHVRRFALLFTLATLGACTVPETTNEEVSVDEGALGSSSTAFHDLCHQPVPSNDGSVLLARCPNGATPGSVVTYDVARQTTSEVGLYAPNEDIAMMGRVDDTSWFVAVKHGENAEYDGRFTLNIRRDDGSVYSIAVPPATTTTPPSKVVIVGSKVLVRATPYLFVGDLQTGGEPKRLPLEFGNTFEPGGNGKVLIVSRRHTAVLDLTIPEPTLSWLTLPTLQDDLQQVVDGTFDGKSMIIKLGPYRQRQLGRFDVTTGTVSPLTEPFVDDPSAIVGVYGDQLFFCGTRQREFVSRLPLTGGAAIDVAVTAPHADEWMMLHTVNVSADGKLVLWEDRSDFAVSGTILGQTTDSPGQRPFRLTENAHYAWSIVSKAANRLLLASSTHGITTTPLKYDHEVHLVDTNDGSQVRVDGSSAFGPLTLNSDGTAIFAQKDCMIGTQRGTNVTRLDGPSQVLAPCAKRPSDGYFQMIPNSKSVLYTHGRRSAYWQPDRFSTVIVTP